MANIKSAIKRIDVTKKQTARNKAKKHEIKTYIKKFENAIAGNDKEAASSLFRLTEKKLMKAGSKNILSKNHVSRKMSQLQKKLNTIM